MWVWWEAKFCTGVLCRDPLDYTNRYYLTFCTVYSMFVPHLFVSIRQINPKAPHMNPPTGIPDLNLSRLPLIPRVFMLRLWRLQLTHTHIRTYT